MNQCGGPWKVVWHPHNWEGEVILIFPMRQGLRGWGVGGVSSFKEAKRLALAP